MLKATLVSLLLFLQSHSYAQPLRSYKTALSEKQGTSCYTELSQLTGIFTKVPIHPGFSGGEKAWKNFVARNFRQDSLYLLLRNKSILRDSVVVKFIVRKEQGISNLEAITGENASMKEEALRLLMLSCPYWIPAFQSSGVQVSAWYRQTFIFEVNENEGKVELLVK